MKLLISSGKRPAGEGENIPFLASGPKERVPQGRVTAPVPRPHCPSSPFAPLLHGPNPPRAPLVPAHKQAPCCRRPGLRLADALCGSRDPERPSPRALSLFPKAEAGSPEYPRGTSGSHALSFLRLHHHSPSPPCSSAPQAAAWGQGGG